MWLQLLIKFRKPIIALVCLLGALGSGYYWGSDSAKPKIIVETKVVEKIVEKIVTVEVEREEEKTHTVTTISEKPDGTKETKIIKKTETVSDKTAKSDKNTTKDKKSTSKPKVVYLKNDFRVGFAVGFPISQTIESDDLQYTISAGTRVIGDIWLETLYQHPDKDISLGISVEF
jgi:hypothetical protein